MNCTRLHHFDSGCDDDGDGDVRMNYIQRKTKKKNTQCLCKLLKTHNFTNHVFKILN